MSSPPHTRPLSRPPFGLALRAWDWSLSFLSLFFLTLSVSFLTPTSTFFFFHISSSFFLPPLCPFLFMSLSLPFFFSSSAPLYFSFSSFFLISVSLYLSFSISFSFFPYFSLLSFFFLRLLCLISGGELWLLLLDAFDFLHFISISIPLLDFVSTRFPISLLWAHPLYVFFFLSFFLPVLFSSLALFSSC